MPVIREYYRLGDFNPYTIPKEGEFIANIRDNGEYLLSKQYYTDGKLHRTGDLPAVTMYYANGNIMIEKWYINGRLKREAPKPPNIHRAENGNIKSIHWELGSILILGNGLLEINEKQHSLQYWIDNIESIGFERQNYKMYLSFLYQNLYETSIRTN